MSSPQSEYTKKNQLFTGDCLHVMTGLNSESVDLIYLDPPFNSKRTYSAPVGSKAAGASFKDMWTWKDVDEAHLEHMIDDYPYLVQYISAVEAIHGKPMMAYLTYMTQRILEMHRALKSTGSLYLHCDPTASHYLKVILDRVFRVQNFRNEIVWHYSGWNKKLKTHIERRHDLIFFYTKSRTSSINYPTRPWENKKEYIKVRRQKVHQNDDGREYVLSDAGAGKRIKRYLDDAMAYGVPVDDVWDIPKLNNSDKEKTGYPTQKPLALLNRIIKASSNEGDIVLDPFCGCATTCVAAQQLRRRWIGIDIEAKAASVLIDRLSDDAGLFKDFIHRTDVPQRTDVKIEKTTAKGIKPRLYEQQDGQCNGCGAGFEIQHFEIDHIVPRAKGGGDYYENYQLLCGHCNRTKGDRPMAFLHDKIKRQEQHLKKYVTFGV